MERGRWVMGAYPESCPIEKFAREGLQLAKSGSCGSCLTWQLGTSPRVDRNGSCGRDRGQISPWEACGGVREDPEGRAVDWAEGGRVAGAGRFFDSRCTHPRQAASEPAYVAARRADRLARVPLPLVHVVECGRPERAHRTAVLGRAGAHPERVPRRSSAGWGWRVAEDGMHSWLEFGVGECRVPPERHYPHERAFFRTRRGGWVPAPRAARPPMKSSSNGS